MSVEEVFVSGEEEDHETRQGTHSPPDTPRTYSFPTLVLTVWAIPRMLMTTSRVC
jgi:hypothetical protein